MSFSFLAVTYVDDYDDVTFDNFLDTRSIFSCCCLLRLFVFVLFLEFGMTRGHQLTEYPCAFVFNSNESRNGTFSSPNFPGFYPRDTECHFFFQGSQKEKVNLHFSYFDVEGVLP